MKNSAASEIKITYINSEFKILFREPPHCPNPFTLKVPSSFGTIAFVDIDFERERGQVHLSHVPITIDLADWLSESKGVLYANEYPQVFSTTYKDICGELERAARTAIDFVKYFVARDEVSDGSISPIRSFNVSFDGDNFSTIPALMSGSVFLKQQISLTSTVVNDLQEGIDKGITPFLAMRHLYRAIQETNPRFKWIDATIAAELAVKEALIRSNPALEDLIIEMPSPPLSKLYGSILARYLGSESPFKGKVAKGAEKRNHLVHRPRETIVTKEDADDYVNEVRQAIHHLYTLLYPNWGLALKLKELKQIWQQDTTS